MARARLLKPGFFTNEHLAALSPLHRLCFAGLWTLADRAGRLEDRPRRIKAALFPYDVADADTLLTDLHTAGFIRRYTVADTPIISITKFADHQHPHHREPPSILPAFSPHASQQTSGQPQADASQQASGQARNFPLQPVLYLDPVKNKNNQVVTSNSDVADPPAPALLTPEEAVRRAMAKSMKRPHRR